MHFRGSPHDEPLNSKVRISVLHDDWLMVMCGIGVIVCHTGHDFAPDMVEGDIFIGNPYRIGFPIDSLFPIQ